MVHSYVSNMSSPYEVAPAAFLGGFLSSTHDSSATLGRVFLLHGAVAGTIATSYVSSILLIHISMFSFIFRLPVASFFLLSESVGCTWQASTGFRRVGESDGTALLHLRLYFML
jgi:hypothetical protein